MASLIASRRPARGRRAWLAGMLATAAMVTTAALPSGASAERPSEIPAASDPNPISRAAPNRSASRPEIGDTSPVASSEADSAP